MKLKGMLKFSNKEYDIEFNTTIDVANEFVKHLPITSISNNIGGEIYFRVPEVDIPYTGKQTDEFNVGDVVYWRSPTGEEKYAIAILYGNTKYGDWNTPKTSSPCVKIGEIINDMDKIETIETGETVKLFLKP